MALVADQLDAFPTGSSTPSSTGNLADAAKQATKALKCVAFTTKQVGELLARKHERILKRIGAISEEIESLKTDVMENITHQRARRTQLSEIEEDIEHAQLLGNGIVVESLYDELHVMKEETKREESLYRALCKTVRSRKDSKKQFMQERLAVEEEIRTFAQKQKLIQTLLATCSKQSSSALDYTMASSASQSDCGASVLDDSDGEDHETEHDDSASHDGSSSSGSFPENPLLDSPPLRAAVDPFPARKEKEKVLAKAVSLLDTSSTSPKRVRVRSWSTDCVSQPLPAARESIQTRTRQSLSVHFASPVLMAATVQPNNDQLDNELESLDLSHYLDSINESASSPVSPALVSETGSSPVKDADEEITPVVNNGTTTSELVEIAVVEAPHVTPVAEVVAVVESLVVQTENSLEPVKTERAALTIDALASSPAMQSTESTLAA